MISINVIRPLRGLENKSTSPLGYRVCSAVHGNQFYSGKWTRRGEFSIGIKKIKG